LDALSDTEKYSYESGLPKEKRTKAKKLKVERFF
jgi:hypothetical protein